MQPSLRALGRLGRPQRRRAIDEGRRVLAEAGLSPERLGHPGVRIPHSVALSLFDTSVAAARDPAFPLQAGASVERGDFGVLGVLVATSPTMGEAIALAKRYLPLLHDGARFDLVRSHKTARWLYSLAGGLPSTVASNEYVVAAFYAAARQALGRGLPLREVRFTHQRPDHDAAYEALFGARMYYECDHNALIFDEHVLDARLPGSDPPVHAVLKRYASELLQRLPRPQPFARRVEALARAQLSRTVRLNDLADALFMSESTLQRRLQAEGTSHTQILDRVRRDLAIELIESSDLRISEVAYQLGFSHRPAFNRAFQRWFGVSPTKYRERSTENAFYRFYRDR